MTTVRLGILLGGLLGVFDGLSALLSAPDTRPQIVGIVTGAAIKGAVAGWAIGYFAKRVQSVRWGVGFGLLVGVALALPIALLNARSGRSYYWQIMVPGAVAGMLVGFATQRDALSRRRAPVSASN